VDRTARPDDQRHQYHFEMAEVPALNYAGNRRHPPDGQRLGLAEEIRMVPAAAQEALPYHEVITCLNLAYNVSPGWPSVWRYRVAPQ